MRPPHRPAAARAVAALGTALAAAAAASPARGQSAAPSPAVARTTDGAFVPLRAAPCRSVPLRAAPCRRGPAARRAGDGRRARAAARPGRGGRRRVAQLGYRPAVLGPVVVEEGPLPALDVALARAATPLAVVIVTPAYYGVLSSPVATPQTMTRAQIQAVPQVGEDVDRAVNRLPGVASHGTRPASRCAAFAEVFNLLDTRNVGAYHESVSWNERRQVWLTRASDSLVPRLPTAGIAWEF